MVLIKVMQGHTPALLHSQICNGDLAQFNYKSIQTLFYNTDQTLLTKRHVPLMHSPTLNIYHGGNAVTYTCE